MNTKIEIELTQAQKDFLMMFYNNHSGDAKDNLCTYKPIHVVETIQCDYVPYDSEVFDSYDNGYIALYSTENYETYNHIDELTKDWNENTDEEYNIPKYSSVVGKKINGVVICDEIDYLNAYGIENIDMVFAIERYVPTAFFLIREEAIKYMEYQKHNLNKPRVYTYSPGYSNKGEYVHFYDLLQNLGKQLSLTNEEK